MAPHPLHGWFGSWKRDGETGAVEGGVMGCPPTVSDRRVVKVCRVQMGKGILGFPTPTRDPLAMDWFHHTITDTLQSKLPASVGSES